MKRHRYRLCYVTYNLFKEMMYQKEPFGLLELQKFGIANNAYFIKDVLAFTAEDALVQLRQNEGGWIQKPPYVLQIEALEDE